MKRPYTVPPGYDGSRFTTSDGAVRPVEDSMYTLSVDGRPTGIRQSVDVTDTNDEGQVSTVAEEVRTTVYPALPEAESDIPRTDGTFAKPRVRRARRSNVRFRTASDAGKGHRPPIHIPPISSLADNEDMLLILLIFLLAGEREAETLVPVLALLLAVR